MELYALNSQLLELPALVKKLVYNPKKGIRLYTKTVRAEIKRSTQRRQEKPGKTQRALFSLFEVVFFADFLYPFAPSPKAPTSGTLNTFNLCLGYKPDREGAGVAPAVLPHHRKNGSVYGGS